MFSQGVGIHGHFGSKTKATFCAYEIFSVCMDEKMSIQFPSHLKSSVTAFIGTLELLGHVRMHSDNVSP